MDPPQTGGLSSATLDEARSWGKLQKDARNMSLYADATITLPLGSPEILYLGVRYDGQNFNVNVTQ